jgi:hypothetical protein
MAGCVYDNPGIFDIILFAITGYFFGAICAISLMGWFMALLASMDDISDMCYVSVVYEILPLVVLFIILRALS